MGEHGPTLKELRTQLGYTRGTMCEALGCARSTLRDYERGRRTLPQRLRVKLFEMFQVWVYVRDTAHAPQHLLPQDRTQDDIRLLFASLVLAVTAAKEGRNVSLLDCAPTAERYLYEGWPWHYANKRGSKA